MVLSDNLERLKHISIDTLGLSDSTLALLKWNGLTTILDCIAVFYGIAQERDAVNPWPRLFTALFAEVKPRLIPAGYWDLVMDAQVWRVIEQSYEPPNRRIAHWQGRDQDLYAIPFGDLGLSEAPPKIGMHFENIGQCMDHFLYLFNCGSEPRREIDRYSDCNRDIQSDRKFGEYLFGLTQPHLVELDLWSFVEARVDDFDMVEIDWDEDEEWEEDDEDDDEDA